MNTLSVADTRTLERLQTQGHISAWNPANLKERKRGWVVFVRIPGCWQGLSSAGLAEFARNCEWLAR